MADVGTNRFWSVISPVFHGRTFIFLAFNAPHDCFCENKRQKLVLDFALVNTEDSPKVTESVDLLMFTKKTNKQMNPSSNFYYLQVINANIKAPWNKI